jgi:hypothetical protein
MCKGRNKQGDPCRSTFVGAGGFCTAHDPERKVDMRELGHRGGKARRKGVAEQLPEAERQSLREFLRDGLDHETIRAAIERSLGGNNESARVSAVKLLSDLDLYGGRDGVCSRCGQTEEQREAEVAGAGSSRSSSTVPSGGRSRTPSPSPATRSRRSSSVARPSWPASATRRSSSATRRLPGWPSSRVRLPAPEHGRTLGHGGMGGGGPYGTSPDFHTTAS